MKTMHYVTAALVIIGAFNWGLVGMAKFDLVQAIFGPGVLSTIVYSLVGLAGLYQLLTLASAGRQEPVRA